MKRRIKELELTNCLQSVSKGPSTNYVIRIGSANTSASCFPDNGNATTCSESSSGIGTIRKANWSATSKVKCTRDDIAVFVGFNEVC